MTNTTKITARRPADVIGGIANFNRLKLREPDDVANRILQYFNCITVEDNGKDFSYSPNIEFYQPPTLPGLSRFLGVTVQTLKNYINEGKGIDSADTLMRKIGEVKEHIHTKSRESLSFTNRQATMGLLDELELQLKRRLVINSIIWAFLVIEEFNNREVYNKDTSGGAKFILKSHFGYSESSDINLNVSSKKLEDFMKK